MDRWITTHQPQIIEPRDVPHDATALADHKWRQSLLRHEIQNGIVDYIVDFQTSRVAFAFLLNLADITEHAKDLTRGARTLYLHGAWVHIGEIEMRARALRVSSASRAQS